MLVQANNNGVLHTLNECGCEIALSLELSSSILTCISFWKIAPETQRYTSNTFVMEAVVCDIFEIYTGLMANIHRCAPNLSLYRFSFLLFFVLIAIISFWTTTKHIKFFIDFQLIREFRSASFRLENPYNMREMHSYSRIYLNLLIYSL